MTKKFTKPYAVKGDVLTCENGHQIAVLVKDVYAGEELSPDHFEDWKITMPFRGETIKDCPCEAPFYAWGKMHFKDKGWV